MCRWTAAPCSKSRQVQHPVVHACPQHRCTVPPRAAAPWGLHQKGGAPERGGTGTRVAPYPLWGFRHVRVLLLTALRQYSAGVVQLDRPQVAECWLPRSKSRQVPCSDECSHPPTPGSDSRQFSRTFSAEGGGVPGGNPPAERCWSASGTGPPVGFPTRPGSAFGCSSVFAGLCASRSSNPAPKPTAARHPSSALICRAWHIFACLRAAPWVRGGAKPSRSR